MTHDMRAGLLYSESSKPRHGTDQGCMRVAHTAWAPSRLFVPQGELTITADMEDLSTALFYDTVPNTWVARAYPSMMGLAAWYADLLLRIRVRHFCRSHRLTSQHTRPRPAEHGGPAGRAFVRAGPEGPGPCHKDTKMPAVQALPPKGRKQWA